MKKFIPKTQNSKARFNKRLVLISVPFLVFFSFLLQGCSTKLDPAPSAGFADSTKMLQTTGLPFQKSWQKKGISFSGYRRIYIAPVNTEHLLKMSLWQELGRGEQVKKDLAELTAYTRSSLVRAFMGDAHRQFQVVENPVKETLILEFALVELVPSKAALNAAGLIPPLIIPVTLLGLTARSTVAFEARLRDSDSDEVIAMYGDREGAKISVFNLKNFTWYDHAKTMIDEWSAQFVEVLHRQANQTIKDTPWFELKPW